MVIYPILQRIKMAKPMTVAEAAAAMKSMIREDREGRSAVKPEARNIASSSDKWEGYYLR